MRSSSNSHLAASMAPRPVYLVDFRCASGMLMMPWRRVGSLVAWGPGPDAQPSTIVIAASTSPRRSSKSTIWSHKRLRSSGRSEVQGDGRMASKYGWNEPAVAARGSSEALRAFNNVFVVYAQTYVAVGWLGLAGRSGCRRSTLRRCWRCCSASGAQSDPHGPARPASSQECKDENFEFISRIFARSGINPEGTYLPPWINPVHSKEPKYDMDTAKKEAEMVMCGAVADLLEKTGAFRGRCGASGVRCC